MYEREIKAIKEKLIENKDNFCLFRFTNIYHNNPKPHWYVNVPLLDKDHMILNMITSDTDKNQRNRMNKINPKLSDCFIYISPEQIPVLDHNSFINCLDPIHITADYLSKRIDCAVVHPLQCEVLSLDDDLFKIIINALMKTTQPRIKEVLKSKYAEYLN